MFESINNLFIPPIKLGVKPLNEDAIKGISNVLAEVAQSARLMARQFASLNKGRRIFLVTEMVKLHRSINTYRKRHRATLAPTRNRSKPRVYHRARALRKAARKRG